RALGLLMVDQQSDVMPLDRFPARLVDPVAAELALQPRHGFRDAAIVEVDAILRGVRDRQPVAGFEVALGGAGAVAKQFVVAIEALERRRRDCCRLGGDGHVDRAMAGGGMQRSRRWHVRDRTLSACWKFTRASPAARRDAVAARA